MFLLFMVSCIKTNDVFNRGGNKNIKYIGNAWGMFFQYRSQEVIPENAVVNKGWHFSYSIEQTENRKCQSHNYTKFGSQWLEPDQKSIPDAFNYLILSWVFISLDLSTN